MKNLIYVKKCLGQNGEPINIYKIRTMYLGADKKLEEVVINGFDSFGKILEDPRITPIGRILRKYWIDELPQLYSLARGDIKLVGIRPREEKVWKRYPKSIMERELKQKPGLMAIDYAFERSESFGDQLNHVEDYLNLWEKNPYKTDREYFLKIIKNIILNGVRSN